MAYVIKVNSDDIDLLDFKVRLSQRRDDEIPEGSEVFIWTAETTGGHGLVARGIAAGSMQENAVDYLNLESLMILPTGIYGINDLKPFREIRNGTLLSFLAENFYYHSHRGVASVPVALAGELRQSLFDRFSMR